MISPAMLTIACLAVFKMICTISVSFSFICGHIIAIAFFTSSMINVANDVSFALILFHPAIKYHSSVYFLFMSH